MMTNSLIMALLITVGKIAVSLTAAFAIVYFRFLPFHRLLADFHHSDAPGRGQDPADVRRRGLARHAEQLHRPVPAVDSVGDGDIPVPSVFHDHTGELVEAAKMDKAGPLGFFRDILLPLSRTNIAALFIILFIFGWNQYLWPFLITTDEGSTPS